MTPTTFLRQPEPPEVNFQLQLGTRQIAAVLLMAIILTGMLTTMAYLAGRMTVLAHETNAFTKQPQRAASQVIVVESAGANTGFLEPVKAPEKRAEPKPTTPEHNIGVARAPATGQRYLQVMATDQFCAETSATDLTNRGLPARVVPGLDENSYRVLVGPIKDQDQHTRSWAMLVKSGLTPFERIY